MPPNKEPTEADIIFNKASVALAKSQRLIASWLPPKSAEELKAAKSEEDLESEENAMFAPVPEVLGVGAPLPAHLSDSPLNRRRLISDDKLLQQLLGKKAAKERAKGLKPALQPQVAAQRLSTGIQRAELNDSEEEDTGRSSMFSSRKRRQPQNGGDMSNLADVEEPDGSSDGNTISKEPLKKSASRKSNRATKGTKRSSSYLDDLLASRLNKKKKSSR